MSGMHDAPNCLERVNKRIAPLINQKEEVIYVAHHYSDPDFDFHHRGNRMNLPDATIAHEGFFVTHFFTVKIRQIEGFYV